MMSAVECTHLDEIAAPRPDHTAGCEECLKIGGRWVQSYCYVDDVMFVVPDA